MTQLPEKATLSSFNDFTTSLTFRREFALIEAFYGDRRAARSKVPLINHIVEGMEIIRNLPNQRRDHAAMAAFCIHPMVQSDADLEVNFEELSKVVSADILALAIEYRSVANEYLSHKTISDISEIRLSPIKSVNTMLIADKVQNYKDFILYHHGTHPRSAELHQYFQNWLIRLDCHDVMDEYFPEWRHVA